MRMLLEAGFSQVYESRYAQSPAPNCETRRCLTPRARNCPYTSSAGSDQTHSLRLLGSLEREQVVRRDRWLGATSQRSRLMSSRSCVDGSG
jgi:hypothetical protein